MMTHRKDMAAPIDARPGELRAPFARQAFERHFTYNGVHTHRPKATAAHDRPWFAHENGVANRPLLYPAHRSRYIRLSVITTYNAPSTILVILAYRPATMMKPPI